MRILFIHSCMRIGGAETLLLRLCKYISQDGHHVTVILTHETSILSKQRSNKALIEELATYASIIYCGKNEYMIKFILIKNIVDNFDYIFSLNSYGYIIAMIYNQKMNTKAVPITGCYNAREYVFDKFPQRYYHKIMNKIIRKIPSENIFFMNESCRLQTNDHCGRFLNSPIVPLPVTITEKPLKNRHFTSTKKIVSIGRITYFKMYHFHMVDVIKILRNEGYDVEYHAYGYGEKHQDLQDYIIKNMMQDFVILHQPIEYASLSIALNDAYIFIGMGTSLIESASYGIPAIVAIESNDHPTTYGMFHSLKGWNIVGDRMPNQKEFYIVDIIREILQLDLHSYNKLCDLSRYRSFDFSYEIVIPMFYQSISKAQQFHYKISIHHMLLESINHFMWKLLNRIGFIDPQTVHFLPKNNYSSTCKYNISMIFYENRYFKKIYGYILRILVLYHKIDCFVRFYILKLD